MWWRRSWFSLKGKVGIHDQARAAPLRHPASPHQPAHPCTTASRAASRRGLGSGSAPEMLKVQSNVGNISLLNHAPNFRVVLLGMVARNSHGHNEFSYRQVCFAALRTLSPTRAHPRNRTGFNEGLKHLFNFGGLCVEFLHWVSPLSAYRYWFSRARCGGRRSRPAGTCIGGPTRTDDPSLPYSIMAAERTRLNPLRRRSLAGGSAPRTWGVARLALRPREGAMHAHAADPKGLGDSRRSLTGGVHLAHPLDRHRRLAAFVDALRFRGFDPRLLLLADELALHLGHHAEHRHEDRSCGVLGREGR